MKIINCVNVITISFGLCSMAMSASAQEIAHYPNYPVNNEIHSVGGGAGPFIAAAMMGAYGWSNIYPPPANWETDIANSCQTKTRSLIQSEKNTNPNGPLGAESVWPHQCNPAGMSLALNAIPNPPTAPLGTPAPHWVKWLWDSGSKTAALDAVYNSILVYKSPAIIPIYGVADHWISIYEVRTTNNVVTHVKWSDGGPDDMVTTDGLGNTYDSGANISTPFQISTQYYFVVTAINSQCDPPAHAGCTMDPYYNKFILMLEPPLGENRPLLPIAFARPPGIAAAMNEYTAQTHVWSALSLARINTDSAATSVFNNGVAGSAFLVNAVYPSGDPWDYYLVPILSKTAANKVIAFVQLAADDGSFENIHVFSNPIPFAAITMIKAESMARSMLAAGERLTRGVLTWDPLINIQMRKSPLRPYYEFGIANRFDKKSGVIRVSFSDGTVVRD